MLTVYHPSKISALVEVDVRRDIIEICQSPIVIYIREMKKAFETNAYSNNFC